MLNKGIYHYNTGVVDFPDKWAMTLFFCGCNLDCSFCYNKHVVNSEPVMPKALAYQDFKELRVITPNVGMVLSGGEPSVNQDAYEFAGWARENGIPLALHTNGVNRMDGHFDSIILSIKPLSDLSYIKNIYESLKHYKDVPMKQLRYVTGVKGEKMYRDILSSFSTNIEADGWELVPVENVLK